MQKINPKFECTFVDGRPVMEKAADFESLCKKYEGKKGFITITSYRKMKTLEQNKYYRGVVVALLAEYWGCVNEEAHQAISNEHLKYQKHYDMPPLIKSTKLSDWNTVDWEEYMEHLRKWSMQEFNVYIPLPNEIDLSTLPDIYY